MCWRSVLGTAGCTVASLDLALHVGIVPRPCDNRKLLQILPNVLWGTKLSLDGNHTHQQIIGYAMDYSYWIFSLMWNYWTEGDDLQRDWICAWATALAAWAGQWPTTVQDQSFHFPFSPPLKRTLCILIYANLRVFHCCLSVFLNYWWREIFLNVFETFIFLLWQHQFLFFPIKGVSLVFWKFFIY